MTRPETNETPREFDRYIRGFFVGLLGILFLTTWACVILFQKHAHPKTGLAEITSQAKPEPPSTADIVTSFTRTELSANRSSGAVTSVKSPIDGQSPSDFSSKESLGRTEIAQGSTPSPVPVLTPQSGQLSGQVNRMDQSNSVRKFRRRAPYPNHRSARQFADAEAKRRLLQLWRRSLAKSEAAQN
jgi:hypothetical protein